jgi:hypothetical protein
LIFERSERERERVITFTGRFRRNPAPKKTTPPQPQSVTFIQKRGEEEENLIFLQSQDQPPGAREKKEE